MIDHDTAVAIRAKISIFEKWRNGRTSYRTEEVPENLPIPTNDEISSLEVFEFMTSPPDRYFLYINDDTRKATTWTGETLGDVRFGRPYRDNFGGTRVPIRINVLRLPCEGVAMREFTCGTRTVIPGPKPNTWRVVCATCEAGGTVIHETKDSATKACVRDSARACTSCGAS